MKILIPLVAVATLSACALPDEQQQFLVDAAIAQVQAANDAGIDPIKAKPEELAVLTSACTLLQLLNPGMADDIASGCAVIQEAAK